MAASEGALKAYEGVWKECPDDVNDNRKYHIDGKNPRIATKVNSNDYCTIIGSTPIHLNKVATWNVKILNSNNNIDGSCIYIGIAPSDINQNDVNYDKCGWYFICYCLALYSGPPHNYGGEGYGLMKRGGEYGPRKGYGEYVHTGDSIGVIMDTTRGDLSFVLNNVNLGVAYEGIPLDKPLVPCVLLKFEGDSVELDTSEVKENVSSYIPAPSNITAESTTWDSITLTWDKSEGASFYQIEVDGNKCWDVSIMNGFTKIELLPDTEHSFRVRAVRGSSVSEWSDVMKGRTLKKWDCVWKKCPGDVHDNRKYSVDGRNPRVATKINRGRFGNYCAIIGDTPIPLSAVTSWGIKILKSRDNDGDNIYVGVAPSDIDQNNKDIYDKCGWYFYCYYSELYSGPPHSYRDKAYGPRNGWGGRYVHTGDSVGVVMDTIKGDLSFVLNNANLGAAYSGIPLDKPLVPCVLLYYKDDSVELDIPEVKRHREVLLTYNFFPGFTAKSITWDSITLAWDKVAYASFYQVEVDGSISCDIATTSFTQRGLLPDTEHSFRVRTVTWEIIRLRFREMSHGWSGVFKFKTLKIHIPSNIKTKSTSWDTITLSWDKVDDSASYQVEVDGSKSWDIATTNTFTKRGLLPETEHSFRVRTVMGSSMSEWSDIIKEKTLKWECVWKECPDDVDRRLKYNVDGGNPRIATKDGSIFGGFCTIIGNAPIPINKVTSWSIKILESMYNDGDGICIGIAQNDINQNDINWCGWYFYCYRSWLYSGPPHSYRGKEYGPRKRWGYVRTGDSVGVVMDTKKGELSFVLNGVNLGAAYCGIPLDKPLVPCALLGYKGDSVELII